MPLPTRPLCASAQTLTARLSVAICTVAILAVSAPQFVRAAIPAGTFAAGSLSITDETVTEGDAGSRTMTFTVTHTGVSDPFYVDAFTADGTATTADNDYTATGGQAGFNGDDGEKLTFSVDVTGDTKDESPHETFYVDLSNVLAFGAPGPFGLPSIAKSRGAGTIVDNDGGGGGGGLTVVTPPSKSIAFEENNHYATFYVEGEDYGQWTAVPTVPWITIQQHGMGSGSGLIGFSVDQSLGGVRSGQIRVGPATLDVTQAGISQVSTTFGCSDGAGRGVGTSAIAADTIPQVFSWKVLKSPSFSGVQTLINPIFLRNQPNRSPDVVRRCNDFVRTQAISLPSTFLGPLLGQSARAGELVRGFRDFNGDGLEEIVVFGPELEGAGRGAWLELYNAKGKRQMSFFADPDLLFLETAALDTDGNGKAEAVLLGTEASGSAELQLRNTKGNLEDRRSVSPEGASGTRIMGFEFDGARGEEIGIVYADKKGAGEFAVWERDGKKLKQIAKHSVIPAKSAFHQWLLLDIDVDGRDEIAASYADASGRGATLRVMDPRSGKLLVDKTVLSKHFEQAVWSPGDFDTARPGAELLVGYSRKGSGKVYFKVLDSEGITLSTSPQIGRTAVQAWGTIRSRQFSSGLSRSLVFVAFLDAKGNAIYEVWDPSTQKARRMGSGTGASTEYEVVNWQTGDFDGDAENGEEIVAVTRHLGDRSVGFQMFGNTGNALGSRVQVFDSNFVNVSVSPIVFASKARTDLAFGARTIGGVPQVHVWNVNGGKLLKKLGVLGKSVE